MDISGIMQLTSSRDTPIAVIADHVAYVEGYDFGADDKYAPNHVGTNVTLISGQWGDHIYVKEDVATVIGKLQEIFGLT